MTVYARSDIAAVTISAAHGGCNKTHSRPVTGGAPVHPWQLDCPPCEDHLRHDPHWSATASEIPETHDETKAREDFDRRGARDKDAIMTLALARLAGIAASELPESLTRMVSGAPLHVPVQGQVECPAGHAQAPGHKFCGECGQPMSGPPAAALAAVPQEPAASPPAATADQAPVKVSRLRDANLGTLRSLARGNSLDDSGTRAELITRLSENGVTSAAVSGAAA